MRRLIVFGGTSAIAEATAREFAANGDAIFLVGRAHERLAAISSDLRIRGASKVALTVQDLRDVSNFEKVLDEAQSTLGGLDAALIAHGSLSDQLECESDLAKLIDEVQTNVISVMALCTVLANRFVAQRHGVIAVISSVAGDRGRSSNYVYGSSKAAITSFTSGLRQRLRPLGVSVVTIKPGFVDTPMTAAFRKGFVWAQPKSVARSIARAMRAGTPVIYTPWFWRPIMFIIKAIPECIFQRLKL